MLLKPKNSVISNPRRYLCCTQVSISIKITDLSRQSMVELYRTCRDRTYRESDPTLHRLIRNFKDSAQSTPGILMTERGGENCISFAEELPSREFLLAPPEYLGAYVTTLIAQCLNTKQNLLELGRITSTASFRNTWCPMALITASASSRFAKGRSGLARHEYFAGSERC